MLGLHRSSGVKDVGGEYRPLIGASRGTETHKPFCYSTEKTRDSTREAGLEQKKLDIERTLDKEVERVMPRFQADHAIEQFSYRMFNPEMTCVARALGFSESEVPKFQEDIKEFQKFVRGDNNCDLNKVRSFASHWSAASKEDRDGLRARVEGHKEVTDKVTGEGEVEVEVEVTTPCPWFDEIDKRVSRFMQASEKISVFHTQFDPKTQTVAGEFDIAKQSGAIINAASRTGWGASGAAKAIQNALNKVFKKTTLALYKQHTNIFGNAQVGKQAFVVPVTQDMLHEGDPRKSETTVVVSVAGPNLNSLSFKFKSLFMSKEDVNAWQEKKLRLAIRTALAAVEEYNEKCPDQAVTEIAMTPISTGKFGYPKREGALVLVDELSRFMTRQGTIESVQVLIVNDPGMKVALDDAFAPMDIRCQKGLAVSKPALSQEAASAGLVNTRA